MTAGTSTAGAASGAETVATDDQVGTPSTYAKTIEEKRQGPVEQVIVGVVNITVVPMSNAIAFMAESGLMFLVFAVVWVGFGAALLLSQGSLDGVWQWVGAQPLVVQGVAWLLFLPVMGGLWIWESTWPLVVRLVFVGGLAWWNLLVMLPRAAQH